MTGETYVAWLSRMTNKTYRLLTEAEWEYAARAGTMTAYYWGESCEWCDALYRPEHIGIHKPNAFTLYNMTDNVEQWVEDCWHPNYEGAPIDGSAWLGGDCGQRVVRGVPGVRIAPVRHTATTPLLSTRRKIAVSGWRAHLNPKSELARLPRQFSRCSNQQRSRTAFLCSPTPADAAVR